MAVEALWFETPWPRFDGRLLSQKYRTSFFEIAQRVMEIPSLPSLISGRRFCYQENGRSTAAVEMTLNLPDFVPGVESPRVYAVETPEAASMFVGRWQVYPDGSVAFTPSRFATGVPAQLDIRTLTDKLIQLPPIKEIIQAPDLDRKMFITELIRDPTIRLQEKLWYRTAVTVPLTQIDIHHHHDPDPANPFTRYPGEHNNLKLGGIDVSRCEMLVLCDPFASGMQIVKALEIHLGEMRRMNGGKDIRLKTLLVFAPLATAEGAAIIGYAAAGQGINTVIFSSAGLLKARSPEMYWCAPHKDQPHLVVNNQWLRLIEFIEGDAAYGLCRKGNWAAWRLSPPEAKMDSELMELLPLWGLFNSDLINQARLITPKLISSFGLLPSAFVTASTLEEAKMYDQMPSLNRFIYG